VAKKAALAFHPVISKTKGTGFVFVMPVMRMAGLMIGLGTKPSGVVMSFGPISGDLVCG